MQETYIPLYRKYRPQKFADLIGQENLVNILSNAIKLDKIAHAYLFCGPRGTGKTSSAHPHYAVPEPPQKTTHTHPQVPAVR